MNYNFKTGDILFCTRDSILSKIIKFATRSKFSHTALVLEINNECYIIDAQKDGVNLRPFKEWLKDFKYNFKIYRNLLLVDNESFVGRALSKSGNTPYDFTSLIIKQPKEIITGKWKYKGLKEESKMYCSEFVAWCYKWEDYYRMSPEDVFERCVNLKFEEVNGN